MSLISVRDNQNNRNLKKTRTEKNKGEGSHNERVGAKWLCRAFKLGFLKLICKASLIFKSNLELVLSIILKKRIIRVKTCYGGV